MSVLCQIYILKKHIETATFYCTIYCEAHRDIRSLHKLHEHLQQHKVRDISLKLFLSQMALSVIFLNFDFFFWKKFVNNPSKETLANKNLEPLLKTDGLTFLGNETWAKKCCF